MRPGTVLVMITVVSLSLQMEMCSVVIFLTLFEYINFTVRLVLC
jgi:hypothetical protein